MATIDIRPFEPEDLMPLIRLFRDSVRQVAIRDYTQAQVEAWAPDEIDPLAFGMRFARQTTMVAVESGATAGFATIDERGHIDLLFVHPGHQRRGVGRALLSAVEDWARVRGLGLLSAHGSFTARPLFEAMGFTALIRRRVEIRGQALENFRMEKPLQTDGQPSSPSGSDSGLPGAQ